MKKRRSSIYEKFRSIFFLMSVVPVIILSALLALYITLNNLNQSNERLAESVTRTQTELDQRLQQAYQIGKSVAEDSNILKILSKSYDLEQERRIDELTVNNELGYISRYFDSRIQVYILAENGALFKNGRFSFVSDDFRQEDWYRTTLVSEDAIWFHLSGQSRVVQSVNNRYATIGIPIRSKGDARSLGVLLVEIQVADILNELEIGNNHYYIIAPDFKMQIVNERVEQYDNDVVTLIDGRDISVLYREDEKPSYVNDTSRYITYWKSDFQQADLGNSGGNQLYYAVVETNRWILVSCISYWELHRTPLIILGLLVGAVLLLILLTLLFSDRVARSVTKPIKMFNDSAHKVSDGNFD